MWHVVPEKREVGIKILSKKGTIETRVTLGWVTLTKLTIFFIERGGEIIIQKWGTKHIIFIHVWKNKKEMFFYE